MAAEASPTQIFNFYYARVIDVISQKNPTGIQDVGDLLKRFPGKEYQVYVQICKKCGVHPEEKHSSEDLANFSSGKGKVSNWLIKKGYNNYAQLHGFVTMKWGTFLSISTTKQLEKLGIATVDADNLLRSILSEVCETAKEVDLPISKPERKEAASESDEPARKLDFEVGETCFTRVLKYSNKDGKEKWVSARVTNVNQEDNTFDIFVINAKAHGVPPEAVNVPRSFLKKSSDHVEVSIPEPRSADVYKYKTDDRVRVVGLRSHTQYNGLCGTILLVRNGRYQVRLDTGDVFAVRKRNISPEDAELPKEAIEVAIEKIKTAGIADKAQEDALIELMDRLFRSSPSMDHIKFGEFAAGFFIAKQKILSEQGKRLIVQPQGSFPMEKDSLGID